MYKEIACLLNMFRDVHYILGTVFFTVSHEFKASFCKLRKEEFAEAVTSVTEKYVTS